MIYLKNYIIKIIILCTMLQFGSFLVRTESFKRLYKLVGSVILMVSVLNIPSCSHNYQTTYKSQIYTHNINDGINTKFTENVKEIIIKDIKDTYKIDEFQVNVESDYSSVSIYIYGDFSDDVKSDIENHIKSKYCTYDDEVVVKNEYY